MSVRTLAALVALALPLAGCAAPAPLVAGTPKVVRGHALTPGAVHEECFAMAKGDAVTWRFAAQAPLHFNIHYHEGKAVVMPVSRDGVREDDGRFEALVAHDYCLMWEAGRQGTPLDYTIELHPRAR